MSSTVMSALAALWAGIFVPNRRLMAAIVEAVNALRTRNDYLFTTGGIGPTHDDITADAVVGSSLLQFDRGSQGFSVTEHAVAGLEMPPMRSVQAPVAHG